MATKQKTLQDAFYETLKDVYYAEKQSVRALNVISDGIGFEGWCNRLRVSSTR